MEEVHVAQHAELGALRQVAQVGIHECPELRTMDCHPLPKRRLMIHLRGEVEIGVSDGRTPIFRPGDARLMEDTFGRGYTHRDLREFLHSRHGKTSHRQCRWTLLSIITT
jgi:hypothetical protein